MRFRWFGKKAESSLPKTTPQTVSQVLAAYGALMERHPTARLDTRVLPLPKSDMKRIIKATWRAESNEAVRSALENAFIGLSNFQDGVGEKPIDSILPPDPDPAAAIAILTSWLAFSTKVNSEALALLADFNDFKQSCMM